MRKVKIVGLIASKNGVTIFMENGLPEILEQNSFKTKIIAEAIAVGVAKEGFVEIDLDEYAVTEIINAQAETMQIKVEDGKTLVEVKTPAGESKSIEVGDTLINHIEQAAYGHGMKGFESFMQKFAEQKCTQTAEELLRFMKNTDLPIADDGTVVVYKILKRGHGALEGKLVDPHTQKVPQQLGSSVEIDRQILDPSKRNLCSTGLHVCYKDYVGGFGGDVLTLCKVEPMDCIAVAAGEHKMRVAAYQICAVLSENSYAEVKNGGSAARGQGTNALIDVIEGRHPPLKERVIVHGTYGSNIEIIPVDAVEPPRINKGKPKRVLAPNVTPKDLKKVHADAKAPSEGKLMDFYKKMKKALGMVAAGTSQREVVRQLKLDRETLGNYVRGIKTLPDLPGLGDDDSAQPA